MNDYWNALATPRAHRIVASVVLVICAFFAFAPDESVTSTLPLPWSEAALAIARAAFLVIGAGAGVLLWRSFSPQAGEFLPVPDAVRMANDALYETEWGSSARDWARESSPEDAVVLAARRLHGRIPLYGVPASGSERREIAHADAGADLVLWTDSARVLRRRDRPDEVLYTDLAFKASDVRAFIQNFTL